jgi:hypothetical protein
VTRLLTILVPAVAVLALGACSEDEIRDAASDAASDAACSVAERALSGVRDEVEQAARDIGADPAAARRELTALRASLSTAERGLSGESRQRVEQARAAVDDLLAEARRAADGTQVDDQAVAEAQAEYDEATRGLTEVC